jgi:hypothetical protein
MRSGEGVIHGSWKGFGATANKVIFDNLIVPQMDDALI